MYSTLYECQRMAARHASAEKELYSGQNNNT